MYRYAMKLTIVLSAVSAMMIPCHYLFGWPTARGVQVMIVGVGFWLLMFWGYRSDYRQRQREHDDE